MKRLLALMLSTQAMWLFAQQALLIPDTLSGSRIQLNLQKGNVQLYPGNKTSTMGANGPLLGPTLILRKHQNVSIAVKNDLGEPTTIHWHGMHVSPENDGGPHVVIDSGATWEPSMEVLDLASTHWYHPHLHMKTNEHVQKGIAGFIIVRDSVEGKLVLPRTYGVDDIPLVIQTKVFDANRQIVTGQNAMDTALMVNGTLKPYVSLPAQVVRLRLLNGSSERAYMLGFTDNRTFYQIGTDGGLLTAPVTLTRLLLAPGERAEILVNLSGLNGSTLHLKNYGQEINSGIHAAPQPGMGPGQVISNYTSNPLNGKEFNILEIRVSAQTAKPVTTIPATLVSLSPFTAGQANITRTLTFTPMNMGPGAINGPFLINGAHFDMNTINYQIPFNNIEIWELRNQTPIAHPFHIHNVQFYVLSVNGAAPAANLQGRKDVILVPGGNGVVRFITRFEDFYDDTMPYMYHCHMLTHEDDGMMGQYIVKTPCNYISVQPVSQPKLPGETAVFTVQVKDTTGLAHQWQSNIGFGFQDLQNAGQYSGATTGRLEVASVNTVNNNQLFRCRLNKAGCEQISDVVNISIQSLSRMEPGIRSSSIYPNPHGGTFFIDIPGYSGKATVQIFDGSGRLLNSTETAVRKVTLTSTAPGLYYLRLQYQNNSETFKIWQQ